MDIRKILLEDLIIIRDVFDKKGIRYSLYGGTALGAVRDGGYCSAKDGTLDDDIDIMVPIEDFYKLEDAYLNGSFPEYFKLSGFKFYDLRYTVEELGGYWADKPLAIDIFYCIPTSKQFKLSNKSHAYSRNLCNVCTMLVTEKTCFLQRELLKEHADYFMSFGNEVTVSSATWTELPEYGNPIFGGRKVLFEGELFSIMDNIEDYLDKVYGDWTEKLPTCENHEFKIRKEYFKLYESFS